MGGTLGSSREAAEAGTSAASLAAWPTVLLAGSRGGAGARHVLCGLSLHTAHTRHSTVCIHSLLAQQYDAMRVDMRV